MKRHYIYSVLFYVSINFLWVPIFFNFQTIKSIYTTYYAVRVHFHEPADEKGQRICFSLDSENDLK